MELSVLDLCYVGEGSSVSETLEASLRLARHVEALGYHRVWYAEHHNLPSVASSATAVIIGQVLAETKTIRVGAGGVMLPNHSPLVIAEQFGTLATLYPGRVELGLGRAPGTDQITAQALRRHLDSDVNDFPRDVVELLNYFSDQQENTRVVAIPGTGLHVPLWILGSSLFGAQLAAALGLRYSFASHFAPRELLPALEVYRQNFKPSAYLAKPHAMVAVNVVVAESDEEAQYLFSSMQQAFINLRTGRKGLYPKPQRGFGDNLPPQYKFVLDETLSCSAVGDKESVKAQLREIISATKADELIINTPVWDEAARNKSFEYLSEIKAEL